MDTVLVPPCPGLDPSWSSFQGHACQQVPVVRFFGTTPEGQRCTLHLHGAFPYFFVASPLASDASVEELRAFARRLAAALDVALSAGTGERGAQAQCVYAIEPVRGKSVYGYHASEAPFFKVFLYNPRQVTRVTALLRAGAVLNTSFTIFEAHLPFELHLLADYRLAGMDLARFSRVRFRAPLPPPSSLRWCHAQDLPPDALSPLVKTATTELEVDAQVADVLNVQPMSAVPRDGRLVASLAQIWEEERVRRAAEGDTTPLATPHTQRTQPTQRTAAPPTAPEVAQQQRTRLLARIAREREEDGVAEARLSEEEVAYTQRCGSELGVRVIAESAAHSGVVVTEPAPGLTQLHTAYAHPRSDLPPATPPMLPDGTPLYAYALDALAQRLSPQTTHTHAPQQPQCADDAEHTHASVWHTLTQDADWEARELLLDMHRDNASFDNGDEEDEKDAEKDDAVDERVEDEEDDAALRDLVTALELEALSGSSPASHGSVSRLLQVHNEWRDIIASQHEVEEDSEEEEEEEEEDAVEVPSQRVQLTPRSPHTGEPSVSPSLRPRALSFSVSPVLASVSASQRVPVPGEYRCTRPPPSLAEMDVAARALGDVAVVAHVPAHYSRAEDVAASRRTAALLHYAPEGLPPLLAPTLSAHGVAALPPFSAAAPPLAAPMSHAASRWYVHARLPPLRAHVLTSVRAAPSAAAVAGELPSAETAACVGEAQGGRSTFVAPLELAASSVAHVRVLALEVLALTRGTLLPHPQHDAVAAIACHLRDERGEHALALVNCASVSASAEALVAASVASVAVQCVADEHALFEALVNLVRRSDPDVLVGYEVETQSLGYLVERAARLTPPLDLCDALARAPQHAFVHRVAEAGGVRDERSAARSEYARSSDAHVTGRLVLTLWRVLRSELHEQMGYSWEHCAWRILRERHPAYAPHSLTAWWRHPAHRTRALRHVLARAQGDVAMLSALNVLGRSAEMARLYGCDLWSVLSRGSQFKVEAMLCRLSKAQNLLLYSPSKADVAQQRAPECLALVLEPQSRFYAAPVLVLDFQSLYPSIVIAYNLCYSTCLGALSPSARASGLGCAPRYTLPRGLLGVLEAAGALTITPNDTLFLSAAVQRGILPQMLSEILETRIMVKQALKQAQQRGQRSLSKTLDARQLALKMLANVTYGYTGANYSGRMPCIDLADAIVQTARETLEAAARLIASTPHWGARVVYGDTDSLFVLCEGATLERAFALGREIAATITQANPAPVKLNFEKVYYPCVLVTKKRYAGWRWDSERGPPSFEAKGLETVRRDTCALVSQTLRGALERLFRTRDLSVVQRYVQAQCAAVHADTLPLSAYIFRKEVRLGTYAQPPPAAVVAAQLMARDVRAEPRYGERVPYVVLAGPPSARLQDLVASPWRVLQDLPHARVHARYYVTKALLPALQRVLACAGVDVWQWYRALPRTQRLLAPPPLTTSPRPLQHAFTPASARTALRATAGASTHSATAGVSESKTRIDAYYRSAVCAVCAAPVRGVRVVCVECAESPVLAQRRAQAQRALAAAVSVCAQCCALNEDEVEELACQSLDCELLYARLNAVLEVHSLSDATGT